jgi:hypothetical protein
MRPFFAGFTLTAICSNGSLPVLDSPMSSQCSEDGSIPVLCPVKRAKKRLRAFFFYGSLPIADKRLAEGGYMQTRSVMTVKAEIEALGPVLPGSISKQWNVCGKPGCRCKDPKHPQRHGPYYQLSYTLAGHSSTMFLKPGELAMARRCIRRYGRLKELTAQLVVAYVAQARREGIASLTEGN